MKYLAPLHRKINKLKLQTNMVRIKPFQGIRPPKELASEVAARPYDVLNSVEAKAEAGERSLLHIIKPEIDFDPIADEHSLEAYD